MRFSQLQQKMSDLALERMQAVATFRDLQAFDALHAQTLKDMWFLGDVHGRFDHIEAALMAAHQKPRWLIFLGDVEIWQQPFEKVLAPWLHCFPATKVAFIYGNHDADSFAHWQMLHRCGDALALHGQVCDLDGVRVAGLGGNFLGRIWRPPDPPKFQNKDQAMNRGSYQWRDGQRPNPAFQAAIYPDDFEHLSTLSADILVTHEAPSCHPFGFEVIDHLARAMKVARSFHGHQHDDQSHGYALLRDKLGFDAKAVAFRAIKNGLGNVVHVDG